MNKVVYVRAHFVPVGENKTVKVPTGEIKTNYFGDEEEVFTTETHWVQTGYSDCKVDSKRLAEDLELAIESLNSSGYEVVSITPVLSGDYDYKAHVSTGGVAGNGYGGYGYGYGYSFTESLIVVAKKTM